MISNSTPTIFESFNARFLEPHQVAKTFVPSENFSSLLKRNHSLVVGPRGSGKTTLLKMLECEALESWDHESANEFRNAIDFIGVFIPTDRVWKEQIDAIQEKQFSNDHQELISRGLFCSHVLHRFVDSLLYRTSPKSSHVVSDFRRLKLSQEVESTLVGDLAEAWHLKPRRNSLSALRTALSSRKGSIPELISSEIELGAAGRAQRLAGERFLHVDVIKALETAIDCVEEHTGERNRKWALLFDELELAPPEVVKHLLRSLRSADNRILFKLSLAPYSPDVSVVEDMFSAMSGNDYEYIKLWYANKEDGHSFCETLLESMLKERGLDSVSAEMIFGKSRFERDQQLSHDKSDYTNSSPIGKLFRDGSRRDSTLRKYFQGIGIDLNNISALPQKERASKLRKVVSILRVRLAFRASDKVRSASGTKRKASSRSRKALPPIYSGVSTIFEILEGNPRWFIGVMSPLLDEYARTLKPIPPRRQMVEVRKAINTFRALLGTIPSPFLNFYGKHKGVDKALDIIGDFFHKSLVLDAFNPEPPGSFIVDQSITEEYRKSLGAALNAGALVFVSGTSSQLVIDELVGKRFRLTYLLAPYYKTPVLLMREVSLKTIFQNLKGGSVQPTLFDSIESSSNEA